MKSIEATHCTDTSDICSIRLSLPCSVSARMAVAASTSGDGEEARFWRGLPHTLAALQRQHKQDPLSYPSLPYRPSLGAVREAEEDAGETPSRQHLVPVLNVSEPPQALHSLAHTSLHAARQLQYVYCRILADALVMLVPQLCSALSSVMLLKPCPAAALPGRFNTLQNCHLPSLPPHHAVEPLLCVKTGPGTVSSAQGTSPLGDVAWLEAADLSEARERAAWHEAMDRRNTSTSERLQVRTHFAKVH